MKMKQWKRGLLLTVLLAALLATSALARGAVDTGRTASLTIQYPVAQVEFRLFRAADISRTGTYALTEDFAKYRVALDQPDQEGWRGAAAALAGYAERDGLIPAASGKTESDGCVTFPQLTPGMYLVVWRSHTSGGYRYTPEPFLVSLPGLDEADNWVYSVTAVPKFEKKPVGDSQPDTVDRKVLKVWEDDGWEEQRPNEVRVQLLRDGKVWDTVTLNRKNGWHYTWKDLSGKYTWSVSEESVPDGYTVTVNKEGVTFVLTNAYVADIPEEPTPEGPGEPDTLSGPDTPEGEDIPEETVPKGPGLPQTGVLWWPVPILACCGMGLFVIGWARRRQDGAGNE